MAAASSLPIRPSDTLLPTSVLSTLARPTSAFEVKGHRNRFSWSGIGNHASFSNGKSGGGNPYEVPLEVGDEVYAFEEYRTEMGLVWYRG